MTALSHQEESKCENSIRGCQIIMPKNYLDFHQENLCRYRPIEKNIMKGIFHTWYIKNQYKIFAVFEESYFLVKNWDGKVKIKGQNIKSYFYLEFFKTDEIKYNIMHIFYKHNVCNVCTFNFDLFKEGILKWRIRKVNKRRIELVVLEENIEEDGK